MARGCHPHCYRQQRSGVERSLGLGEWPAKPRHRPDPGVRPGPGPWATGRAWATGSSQGTFLGWQGSILSAAVARHQWRGRTGLSAEEVCFWMALPPMV